MKYIFIILLIIYIIGVVASFFAGLALMILNSEYGREDDDYIEGKYLVTHSIIFPYAVYKIVKARLDIADETRDLFFGGRK